MYCGRGFIFRNTVYNFISALCVEPLPYSFHFGKGFNGWKGSIKEHQ